MPKLGYGYAHYSGFGSTLPNSISGLSLWLKADAGVVNDKFTYDYASRIVLSGGDGAGTYNITSSVPTFNTHYNNPDDYSLGGISWVVADGQFGLNIGDIGGYSGRIQSPDGVSWEIVQQVYDNPSIGGVTGMFSGANGQYYYSNTSQNFEFYRENGDFTFSINGSIGSYSLSAYNINTQTDYGNIATYSNGVWTSLVPETTNISGGVSATPSQAPTGVVTTSQVQLDTITKWNDQSGNNKNATSQVTTFFIKNAKNGNPAISFYNSRMVAPGVFSGANPRTLFVVYYTNNTDGVSNTICGQNNLSSSDTGTYFLIQARNDALNSSPYFAGYASDLTGPAYQNNVWKVAVASYDGTTTNLYSNGNLENSGAMSLNTYNQGDCFILGCFYENNFADYAEFFKGNIAEILAYNRALSSIERQQVEGYLNAKYAIY